MKKTLKFVSIAAAASFAIYAVPPFVKGFREGAREQWKESFPNGFRAEINKQ